MRDQVEIEREKEVSKVTIEKEICVFNGVKIIARSSDENFDFVYIKVETAEKIIREILTERFRREAMFAKGFTIGIDNE